jgi:hypothetical protein
MPIKVALGNDELDLNKAHFNLLMRVQFQASSGPRRRHFSIDSAMPSSVADVGLDAFGGLSVGCQWNFLQSTW